MSRDGEVALLPPESPFWVERIVAGTQSSTISRGLNPCELTRSMKGDAPAGVSTRRFRDKEIALKRILVLYSHGHFVSCVLKHAAYLHCRGR
jgi:hypothetical protein